MSKNNKKIILKVPSETDMISFSHLIIWIKKRCFLVRLMASPCIVYADVAQMKDGRY